MDIAKRFVNIVKTNKKNFNDTNLSEEEINSLLMDNSDDELSRQIAEANKKYYPKDIMEAFGIMEMKATDDMKLVSLQFKNLMNKYHPDKSSVTAEQSSNTKTAEIIVAHNIIKEYFIKNDGSNK